MSNSNLDQTAAELGMGGNLAPEQDDAGYRKRMERRQQVQRQRVEERNQEKGSENENAAKHADEQDSQDSIQATTAPVSSTTSDSGFGTESGRASGNADDAASALDKTGEEKKGAIHTPQGMRALKKAMMRRMR